MPRQTTRIRPVTVALLASNVIRVARYADVDSLAGGITAVVMREVSRYLDDLAASAGTAQPDAGFTGAGLTETGFTGAGLTETGLTGAGLAETGLTETGSAEGPAAADPGQSRRRLLGLLVSMPSAPLPVLGGLARSAGWPLPRRVCAVALGEHARSVRGTLPPDVLVDLTRRDPCLLVPDPDGPGRQRVLEGALRAWLAAVRPLSDKPAPPLAAVGPAVPLAEAAGSLRWAGQALALTRHGLTAGRNGIVWCREHLATLVLLAVTDLAGTLSREALAPLRQLRPEQADRLAATLLAWLESADDASAAARRIHVHPQTIRYRLRQLAGLFGDALTDPDARFTLLLALRVQQALREGSHQG